MGCVLGYVKCRFLFSELCKKAKDYNVPRGMGTGRKPNKHDISHPRAISAYPPAPCPKTGAVSFVDASALL